MRLLEGSGKAGFFIDVDISNRSTHGQVLCCIVLTCPRRVNAGALPVDSQGCVFMKWGNQSGSRFEASVPVLKQVVSI